MAFLIPNTLAREHHLWLEETQMKYDILLCKKILFKSQSESAQFWSSDHLVCFTNQLTKKNYNLLNNNKWLDEIYKIIHVYRT